jgi:hypothetical protein
MAYVSEYGNYGAEDCVVFETTDVTIAQWETLEILPDYEKMPYILSILNEYLTEDSEN